MNDGSINSASSSIFLSAKQCVPLTLVLYIIRAQSLLSRFKDHSSRNINYTLLFSYRRAPNYRDALHVMFAVTTWLSGTHYLKKKKRKKEKRIRSHVRTHTRATHSCTYSCTYTHARTKRKYRMKMNYHEDRSRGIKRSKRVNRRFRYLDG